MATAKKAAPKKAITVSKTTTKKVVAPTKKVAATAATKVSNTKTPNAIFNIDEINSLIHAVNHSNVNELKLEKGDFKITIKQGGLVNIAPAQVMQSAPTPAVAPTPAAPASATQASPVVDISTDNLITIKSPMIGTFYRAAGPGKPVFANVGDEINVGDVLCIVEAMKLFNEIESEISGKIVKVLTDDASPVEYDQPLFLVQPN